MTLPVAHGLLHESAGSNPRSDAARRQVGRHERVGKSGL